MVTGLPVVKRNFHYVILAIIVLSVLPGVIEYLRVRREAYLISGRRRDADLCPFARSDDIEA